MLKRHRAKSLTMVLTCLLGAFIVSSPAACSPPNEPVLVEGTQTRPSSPSAPEITPTTLEVAATSSTTTAETSEPLPPLVVYDTDMGADVDDVLALAMLHSYADQGLVEIGAVTISRNSEPAAKYTDAVNTFYGRPDIPIGIHKGSYVEFDDRVLFTSTAETWPHDLDVSAVPDAFLLLRELLVEAEAAGRRVIFIQTGFSGNLATLLKSEGDELTPRDGVALVADTVELLSVMAGSIEFGIVEFNIEKDIGNARYLFWKWPTRLVMSPFELGYNIVYPYSSITNDFGWADRHPVREAYEFSDLQWHQDAPPFYDMRSWDLTSVMFAVEPDAGLLKISDRGTVTVAEDGRTTFTVGEPDGIRVDYLLDRGTQYTAEEKQAVVDRMIELVSSPPAGDR